MIKYIKYDEAFINKATEACASDAAAMIKIIDLLHHYPAADVVSREVFEQVKWERDTALQTLREHGIGLGQKADVVEVVRCKDCEQFMQQYDIHNGRKLHYGICKLNSNNFHDEKVNCDHFCSYGKRKEGINK